MVNNIFIESNVVVNRGLDPRWVERSGGRPVREVPIERVARAGPGRHARQDLAIEPARMSRGARAAEPQRVVGPETSGFRGVTSRGPRSLRDDQPRLEAPRQRYDREPRLVAP